MTLRRTVATPFRQDGVERMTRSEFVVSLSLDRDWFSPDQAKRLIDVATGEGLLETEADELRIAFDTGPLTIPEDFEPDESILQRRSTFERFLAALEAAGVDKQTAVAEINRKQADLEISLEAAAALYSRQNDLEVHAIASAARDELLDGQDAS